MTRPTLVKRRTSSLTREIRAGPDKCPTLSFFDEVFAMKMKSPATSEVRIKA